MTARQYRLYELLKAYYEVYPNVWIDQTTLCCQIEGYNLNLKPIGTTDRCPAIGQDVKAINADVTIDKLIVTKKYCFKIATREEAEAEIESHRRRLISQAEQIAHFNRKIGRDGQFKLLNELLNELKPNNEQYHETFKEE